MQHPPENAGKKKRAWTLNDAQQRPRKANIGKLKRKCLTILTRDIEQLMALSYRMKLEPAEGKLLLEYLKFLTEAQALEELEKMK